MNNTTLLILAGGLGSRYQGPKQVDSISQQQESLMEFALYDAVTAGFNKFVFIINDQFPSDYKKRLTDVLTAKGSEVHFVEQTLQKYIPEEFKTDVSKREKPLGTAHAVYCAKEIINEPFVVINADDFYGSSTFQTAYDCIDDGKISRERFAMVAFELKNTLSDNGTVSRGVCDITNTVLTGVEEHTKIAKDDNIIRGLDEDLEQKVLDNDALVSMNFWILHPSFFDLTERDLPLFLDEHKDSTTAEFYLPSVVNNAIQKNEIAAQVIPTTEKWFGLTYPEDKALVVNEIEDKKDKEVYPKQLWD